MKAVILVALLLSGCATTYQCERHAEKEKYGADVIANILIHDNAMRRCDGIKERP